MNIKEELQKLLDTYDQLEDYYLESILKIREEMRAINKELEKYEDE